MGDKVRAFGLDGVVIEVTNDSVLDVCVDFGPGEGERGFLLDGREQVWHKEPSLVLVERPKKKVKKCVGRWAIFNPRGSSVKGYFSLEADANRYPKFADEIVLKLTGEYEVEVDDNE